MSGSTDKILKRFAKLSGRSVVEVKKAYKLFKTEKKRSKFLRLIRASTK